MHHRQAGAACRSRLNIAWKVSGPGKGLVIREKQITQMRESLANTCINWKQDNIALPLL